MTQVVSVTCTFRKASATFLLFYSANLLGTHLCSFYGLLQHSDLWNLEAITVTLEEAPRGKAEADTGGQLPGSM
jgi:hypothetical protein